MNVIKNIEVKNLDKITVAYNRSLGPYKGNNVLYQKHRAELFAWAGSKELMSDVNFKYIILYHDNPNATLNDNQRMSLCVTVPSETETDGIIGKMNI
ncbi:GyrI-like domain-containing protein, partial [Aquimarina celericrescens]|nr:GyrI-like domain-containing protein [Aquimarina celericrescens]